MRGQVVWFSALRGKQGTLMVIIYWHRMVKNEWVQYLDGDPVINPN